MAQDVRFSVANSPGKIAQVAKALGDAGVNIDGMGCDIRPGESWGFIHFLVEDAGAAASALAEVGCDVLDVHDVDLVPADNRPGALAELCQSYADRGENIEVLYLGLNGQVVVGTESMRRPMSGRRSADTSYSDSG